MILSLWIFLLPELVDYLEFNVSAYSQYTGCCPQPDLRVFGKYQNHQFQTEYTTNLQGFTDKKQVSVPVLKTLSRYS